MISVFLVGVGGFLGAISRFGLFYFIRQYIGNPCVIHIIDEVFSPGQGA